ncbi:MAG: hypothetical protein EBT13_10750 [Rhodobacteraceae bacterium]|nr:hypothetical protein [Paracoccaceae bacterium]
MKVTVTDQQIHSWRLKGYSLERIASACGSTTCEVSRRIQQIWQRHQRRPDDPRPDEIRRLCDAIQAEWSQTERARRRVGQADEWKPVVVPASVLALTRS